MSVIKNMRYFNVYTTSITFGRRRMDVVCVLYLSQTDMFVMTIEYRKTVFLVMNKRLASGLSPEKLFILI